MQFASDNAGPVHPEVLDALAAANEGHAAPYGADELTARVVARIRGIFEAPDAAVHLVATGTAANALALALLAKPWQVMFCAPLTHVNVDECHAPEFYTGGAKCHPVGDADKIAVTDLRHAIESLPEGDVHVSQRGPIVLTQATERGRIYSLAEIAELAAAAREHGLGAYMDGARFANALAALNCSAAEMTWKAGVDIVSLGATKNGCMGVEAVVVFDPALSWEFELRRKRAAHLFSKHRYLAAQMDAYLEGDLWLRSARLANERAARLAAGLREAPQAEFLFEPQANMIFATLPRRIHQRLAERGAVYGVRGAVETGDPEEPLACRLVCDWSVSEAQIDRFVEIAAEREA